MLKKERIVSLENKYRLLEAHMKQELDEEKLETLRKQRHACFTELNSLRKQAWEDGKMTGHSDD